MSRIDELIKEKLGGDEKRVAELFHDDAIFDELINYGRDCDWYHFEPKTFDGEYFVKCGNRYSCYLQDRGAKSNQMSFDSIHDAAIYYFTRAGLIPPSQVQQKKWWQFWM